MSDPIVRDHLGRALTCIVCGGLQRQTGGRVSCDAGHLFADGVPAPECPKCPKCGKCCECECECECEEPEVNEVVEPLSLSSLTKMIQNDLAYPFAWEKFGLGDAKVEAVTAYCRDRAAHLAQVIWSYLEKPAGSPK